MYENDFSFTRLFKAYGKIFQFNGRSTRTELLGYWITTWLISTLANYFILFSQRDIGATNPFLSGIVNLIILLPAPALAARRAHDAGWPGVFSLLLVLPALANFVLKPWLVGFPSLALVLGMAYFAGLILLFWKPQEGDHEYGPDPRLIDDRYREGE